MININLQGKRALIEGGSRGIGLGIAQAVAQAGADVGAFLASDLAASLTGQTIAVDGGQALV